MKRIIKIAAGLLGVIFLAIAMIAFIQIDFSNDEDFDKLIETKREYLQNHGMAVVFIKDGKISWSQNYGYADTETKRKVTPQTIFNIASLSKPVTGVAIMQLHEKKLIDLEASINDYLPLKITNPNFPDHKITVRMLMQHTSSLNDDGILWDLKSDTPDSPISLEEFARGYFLQDGQWYSSENNFSQNLPGEEYNYSNVGFGLLGLMVEHITGQKFNEYTLENIYKPLGMASSGWLSTEVNMDDFAIQYYGEERYNPYSYPTYPAGGMITSITDYAKFIIAMTNGGVYEGKRILSKESVLMMLPDNHDNNLVWEDDVLNEAFIDMDELDIQGHSGGDPGTLTFVAFNPKNGNTMIVFLNGTATLASFRVLNYRGLIKRIAVEAGVI